MKETTLTLLLCCLLAAAPSFAQDETDTDSPDTLIGTVNDIPYRLDIFRLFYLEQLQSGRGEDGPAFQQRVFDEFMSLVAASQEAERRQLGDERNVSAALQLERMKVLSRAVVEAMAQEIQPTETELESAYEMVKGNQGRTEYKARHILVKEEGEAKKLIKQLNKGADFAELAKKNSLGPTGKKGGELDWFDPNQMVRPFAEAVVDMQPGTYSKAPVHTEFGWHIINLQETRKAEPPSFEAAKPQLTNIIRHQKVLEKVAEIRNNAMVELNEDVVRIKQIDLEEATPKD